MPEGRLPVPSKAGSAEAVNGVLLLHGQRALHFPVWRLIAQHQLRCEVRDPHVGYIKAGKFISTHPDVK